MNEKELSLEDITGDVIPDLSPCQRLGIYLTRPLEYYFKTTRNHMGLVS